MQKLARCPDGMNGGAGSYFQCARRGRVLRRQVLGGGALLRECRLSRPRRQAGEKDPAAVGVKGRSTSNGPPITREHNRPLLSEEKISENGLEGLLRLGQDMTAVELWWKPTRCTLFSTNLCTNQINLCSVLMS